MRYCFLVLALALNAFAADYSIVDERVINQPISKVHSAVTDYAHYKDLDGARWDIMLGTVRLFSMIKSQPKFDATVAAPNTDAYVFVVLQPTNLQKHLPMFLLRCKSTWISSSEFNHHCDWTPFKQGSAYTPYAVKGFTSEMSAKVDATANKTRLKYRLDLTTNDSEVSEIKNDILSPLPRGVIRDKIDELFDPKSFFETYYRQVYESLVQGVRNY